MADPPEAVPAGGVLPGPDALLATKLYLPRPQAGFVPRPRLARALTEGLAGGRVLVCAPAGFGKTSLLADWARGSGLAVAWVSLDAADGDPAQFWRYVVAALDRARPGLAGRLALLAGQPSPRSFTGLVTALINELAAEPDGPEVLLVLDDYHLTGSGPVHESVAFLLGNLPPGLRLVLSSRADPQLPLARLRASGQLTELRAAELRFTAAESAALIAAAGPALPEAAVAALTTRTEGWAAGLRLAALSLRGQADPAGFVTAFSGSHRFVLDYLADEVLDAQDAAVRGFLLETSVLDRLSGELCDAVTGRPGGQALLEDIERAGLFLVPLDEVRGWWRYHHLFADLLRARLEQEQPGRAQELHRAAAAWSDAHGLADDAVRYALAAADPAWAAGLVERYLGAAWLRHGLGATLRHWLSALPAPLLATRPRLCLAQAFVAVVGGQVEAVGPLLDAAERAVAVAAGQPEEPPAAGPLSLLDNLPGCIAFLQAELARLRGDAASAADWNQRALAELGEHEFYLGTLVRASLAVAQWLGGQLGPAERGLTAELAARRATGEGYLASRVGHDLGAVQRAVGNLDAALATGRQVLESAGAGGGEPPYLGIAHVGMAEVRYQRDELDAALDHATRGVELARRLAFTPPLAAGLAVLAWIRQASGDDAGATAAMDEAVAVAISPQVVALLNPVPAQRARLLLAQRDVAAASRWARAAGLGPDDEPGYPREPSYLALARLLLAQDRPGPALTLLRRLLDLAAAQGRTGSVIEIQALRALALAARGDRGGALGALTEAVTLGCPQGYVRVFADEGPPMHALLTWLADARQDGRQDARQDGRQDARQDGRPGARTRPGDIRPAYLAALVRASGPAGSPQRPPGRAARPTAALPGLPEPLTEREMEVLGLLAAGRSNQRIARDLVVALDTVKKHVTHVLGKLGAANRTEAVARARQLGLIP